MRKTINTNRTRRNKRHQQRNFFKAIGAWLIALAVIGVIGIVGHMETSDQLIAKSSCELLTDASQTNYWYECPAK